MFITSQDYVSFVILLFLFLSVRLGQASRRNFFAVTIGTLTVWIVFPSHSLIGRIISYGIMGLEIAMSPFGPLLFRATKSLLQKSPQSTSSKDPIPGKLVRILTNPDPIIVLHNPTDAEVEYVLQGSLSLVLHLANYKFIESIVAVHGLGSSVERTWTHESGKLWLRDFLPLDFEKARIMTFRHNSGWKSQALAKDLVDHGKQLLDALKGQRASDKGRDRPLILIGHSFGGLLIEQALVLAKGPTADPNTKARHSSLVKSVAGVIFLGTPHAGSSYSWLGMVYCLFHYWEGANPLLLQYMNPNSKETGILEDAFLKYYPYLSFDFHETRPNRILGMPFEMVVTRDSGLRRGQEGSPLDTNHFDLNKYRARDDASYIAVKNKMVEMLSSWTDKMDTEREGFDASELEFLKSLEPCGFTTTVEKRRGNITPGTCQWIVNQTEYQDWGLETNVLWILGNPGSGKTYIAQWICDHINEDCSNNLMYFFFDAKNKDLCSLNRFYQTILHQLLEGIRNTRPKLKAECFKSARKIILKEGQVTKAYIDALQEVLLLAQPSILVIDALDECNDADLKELRAWIATITAFSGLQVVITSRSVQKTKKLRENHLHIDLQLSGVVKELDDDIEKFIVSRIESDDADFPNEMSRVVAKLKARSSGMILYARLMLDILENIAGNEDELLVEMEKLPEKLTDLYADRLTNIKDSKFASRILRWLVTCRRPLTIDALREIDTMCRDALSKKCYDLDVMNPPKGLGKDRSGNDRFQSYLLRDLLPLVEIMDDRTVRLVHMTVSQFLLGEEIEENGKECPDNFKVELNACHKEIALTCVTYLRWSFTADDKHKSDSLAFLNNKDLQNYAVLEWPNHCEKSQGSIVAEDSEKGVIVGFFGGEKAFHAWLTARAELDSLFRAHFGLHDANAILPRPLHITVFFNIWQFGRLFLATTDVNIRDATGSTALHIAAGQGRPTIVKELLGRGARMDLADASGASPLHRAVRRGNHDALAQLLAADTDHSFVNAPDKYKFTPMHVACQLGWMRCATILLEHNASPSNESGAVETPVGLAIENGHIKIVRALLKHAPSLVDHCGRPLIQAARRGSTEMVKFLCKAGVDMSYQDVLGQTALHKACIFGRTELVEYLLDGDKGFVDAKDKSNRTPLYFAAERGHLDVVNCLLRHGADKNSLDRRDETALFKAAGNGHTKVVDCLLTAGTDPTRLDLWQRTPLRFAAMKGRLEIVRMLLNRTKIKQNEPDWVGRTVLHNAAAWLREGQEDVIDVLFEHGADPNAQDRDERTALHAALLREQDQPHPTGVLLDRLIQGKVPIDARDKYGATALTLAAFTQNLTAINRLLAAGATPMSQSLHYAVRSGNIELVKPFLEQDTKLDLAENDWDGNTPLHIAASKGYNDILTALLASGAPTKCLNMDQNTPLGVVNKIEHPGTATLLEMADPTPGGDLQTRLESFDSTQVNFQDTLGRTSLHAAVLLGRVEVTRKLVNAGANTDLADQIGRTPLHYAVQRPDPAITEILVTAKAKIDAADARGRVPLYLATEAGNAAQTRVLLAAKAKFIASQEGLTPLHAAALKCSAKTVQAILEAEKGLELISTQDHNKQTAVHLAARRGNSEVMEELLRHIQDATIIDIQDDEGQTPLFQASKNGHTDIVRQLIQAGSIVYRTDNHRNMAIHLAAEEGHLETVGLLLDELPSQVEAAMEKWGQGLPGWPEGGTYCDQALMEALIKVKALVENEEGKFWHADSSKWSSPDEQQKLQKDVTLKLMTFDEGSQSVSSTTLMRAVLHGHVDVVKLLLLRIPEMPLQARHYTFSNVLSVAARRGETEIAEALINAGSIVSDITDTQETCLHEAADGGHDKMIELLLGYHANPDLARLRDGSTPLHLAAAKGHTDAVSSLVLVAFINCVDDLGRTPLHVACLGCHSAVVEVLIEADADLMARDFDGMTPLELATGMSEQIQMSMQERVMKQKQRRGAGR